MWKREKDEFAPPVRETPQPVREAAREVRPPEPPRESLTRGGIATIGKSLLIKGTIGGTEDLYIDGEVEGAVELKDNNVTVGPNGRVSASIHARDIVVLGRVKGNVRAMDRLEIRKTGSLVGDILTSRVVIEDGAYFKGSIDIQKGAPAATAEPPAKPAAAPAPPPPAASHASAPAAAPASSPAASPSPSSAPAASPYPTLTYSGEPKKIP